jgi:hypothetical protein
LSGWFKGDAGVLEGVGPNDPAEDGDPVRRWEDQSGFARNLDEVTNKPLYIASLYAGIGGVRFDGVNDKLTGTGLWAGLMGSTDWTFGGAFILRANTTDAANVYNNDALACDDGGGGNWGIHFANSSPRKIQAYVFDAATEKTATVAMETVDTLIRFVAAQATGTAVLTLRVNDATEASTSSVGAMDGSGGDFRIGSAYGPSSVFTQIDILELFCYQGSAKNSSDRGGLMDYLYTRFPVPGGGCAYLLC